MEAMETYDRINMDHASKVNGRIVDTIRVIFGGIIQQNLEHFDDNSVVRVPISANELSRQGIGIRSTSNRALKVLEGLGVLQNTGETEQYKRVYLVNVGAAKQVVAFQNSKLQTAQPVNQYHPDHNGGVHVEEFAEDEEIDQEFADDDEDEEIDQEYASADAY
jgi:hypothetical protein